MSSTKHLDDLMKRKKSAARSVKDFHSVEALRGALHSMGQPNTTAPFSQPSKGNDGVVRKRKIFTDTPNLDEVESFIYPPAQFYARHSGRKLGSLEDEEANVKEEMENELRRLAVLKSYRVIGSGKNPSYERLVSLASRIFNAPIVYVSVLDLAKQYLLASRGLDAMATNEQERGSSFCSRLVDSHRDIVVIPDLTQDDLFKNHENVKGLPHLRFYAASPLVCPEGFRLGSLCILDTEPRPEGLSFDMKQNLREIADMVMDVMVEERERKIFQYRQPSQMIACTSNDLMTPLLGVLEGLSTIRDDQELLNSLSSKQKEVFNTAYACSTVMTRICQKSLESFHMDQTNRIKSIPKKLGGSHESRLVIGQFVQHLHMVMDPFPKRVPLVITIFDEVPPVVVADDLKVFRSVINLLTNACANTETGSVHLKVFIQALSEEEGSDENDAQQSIVFQVEDTGCGVSVDQYQFLFKPVVAEGDGNGISCKFALFGDDSARTTKTGLGLHSVATQISSIGGTYGFRPRGFDENGSQLFDVSGNTLKGSVFWISIPLNVPDDADCSIPESSPVDLVPSNYSRDDDTAHDNRKWNADDEADLDESFSHSLSVGEKRSLREFLGKPTGRRTRRALVIDDSLTTRGVISRMLNRLGFEVLEAVNGLEGLKELQSNLYDLVLCDFLMPVLDGFDCVQQYRQYEVASRPWFDQYIVGISAHANASDVERGIKVGMNDYRAKPVTMKHLEEILEGQDFKFVSTRLDSIVSDMRESDEASKLSKSGVDVEDSSPQNEQFQSVCLIVEEGNSISSVANKVVEANGWKSVVVHDGEAALRHLQMRNWDAVLIDDALSGLSSCMVIKHFREWESNNRVNRQKHVYQVNSSFIPSHWDTSSTVQLPSGFDGALGKPISAKILKQLLQRSTAGKNCMSHDIVQR